MTRVDHRHASSSISSRFYSDEEIDKRAQSELIIPIRLESSKLNEDALRHFACWLRYLGRTFDATGAQRPWVPVGLVGPILVIGHSHPYATGDFAHTAPLPNWCAQYVLLSHENHTALIKATDAMIRSADVSLLDTPTRNPITLNRPAFQKKDDVIDFMVRSLVMPKTTRRQLLAERDRQSTLWSEELKGFSEAAQFLSKRTPIIDVRGIASDKTMLDTIPREVFAKFQTIGLFSTANFFYTASPTVPNPALQDRLLTSCQGAQKRKGIVQVLCPSTILSETIAHRSIAIEKAQILSAAATRPTSSTKRTADQSKASIIIDEQKIEKINPQDEKCDNIDRFQWYLNTAAKIGASDLHVELMDGQGVVRARVDGQLREIGRHHESHARGIVGVAKGGAILGLEQSTHNEQNGRGTARIGDKVINLRVSLTPHLSDGFQAMVIRLLPKGGNLLKLVNLGLPDRQLRTLKRAIGAGKGIIIATGSTNSGKTTLIYALLNELNDGTRKIVTIEDPVEIELPGATQSVVNDEIPDKPVTMEGLLAAALRQDPDIIVVGEIRSKETARIALQASMTGHLVFATMHTSSPETAMTRFQDLLEDPNLARALSENILAVVGTTLIQKVCPECSEYGPVTDEEFKILKRVVWPQKAIPNATATTTTKPLTSEIVTLSESVPLASPAANKAPASAKDHAEPERLRPKVRRANRNGCTACANQGYTTRTGVVAILPAIEDIKLAIASGQNAFKIGEIARSHNFRSLERELLQKVLDGTTTFEEITSSLDPWADFDFPSPDEDDVQSTKSAPAQGAEANTPAVAIKTSPAPKPEPRAAPAPSNHALNS